MEKAGQKEFLEVMFSGIDKKSFIDIRTFRVGESGKFEKVDYFFERIKDIDRLVKRLENSHFKELNIHFGVAPRCRESGTEKDVKILRCFWCDVDCKRKNKPELLTKEEALEKIKKFKLAPSIIVDSGNGFHVYWLLLKPVSIKDEKNVLTLRGVLSGLSQALGGDVAGKDLSRCLRIPETLNIKNENPEGLLVKIIKFEPSLTYDIKEFEQFYIEQKETTLGTVNISKAKIKDWIENIKDLKLPKDFSDILFLDPFLKNSFEGERPDLADQSRSGYSMALAGFLCKDNAFTDEEIIKILILQPNGKLRDNTPEYLLRTLSKAKGGYAPAEIKINKEPTNENKSMSVYELLGSNIPEEEMLVGRGLIPKKFGFGLIGGLAKEGKTLLSLQFCLSLISGSHFLEEFPIPKKVKVYYIYHENTLTGLKKIIEKQLSGLNNMGMNINKEDFKNFRIWNGKDLVLELRKPDIGDLKKDLELTKPDIIFLDPLGQYIGFDLNKAENIKKFRDLLREIYPCFWVLIHHYTKPRYLAQGEKDIPPIYKLLGSSYLANSCETFLGLEPEGEKYSSDYKRVYFVLRNEREPLPLHLVRDPKTLIYEVMDSISLLKGKITKEDIIRILKVSFKGKASYSDLARLCSNQFGVKEERVAKLMRELKESGVIDKEPGKRGYWYIKELFSTLFS